MHLGFPQSPLTPKLLHYSHHFLRIDRGLIRPPTYVILHLPLGLWIFLGQFRVCSHKLWIKTDHHLACELRFYRLCLIEPDIKDHFIFQCLIYYEIRGWYHYLFRDAHSLISTFFQFLDHRCLALYRRETFLLRKHLLFDSQHLIEDRLITSFFPLTSGEGVHRWRIEDPSWPTWCTKKRVHVDLSFMRLWRITVFFSYSSINANTYQSQSA